MSLQEAPIRRRRVTDRGGSDGYYFAAKTATKGRGRPFAKVNPACIPPPRRRFSHADREEFPGKSGTRADRLSGLMLPCGTGPILSAWLNIIVALRRRGPRALTSPSRCAGPSLSPLKGGEGLLPRLQMWSTSGVSYKRLAWQRFCCLAPRWRNNLSRRRR